MLKDRQIVRRPATASAIVRTRLECLFLVYLSSRFLAGFEGAQPLVGIQRGKAPLGNCCVYFFRCDFKSKCRGAWQSTGLSRGQGPFGETSALTATGRTGIIRQRKEDGRPAVAPWCLFARNKPPKFGHWGGLFLFGILTLIKKDSIINTKKGRRR